MKTIIPLTIVFLICGFLFTSCDKDKESIPEPEYGSVQDAQGNIYKTVKIGETWWMAENLRSTQFNDLTPIKNVSSSDSNLFWTTTEEPCFTALNSGANGLLYNAFVFNTSHAIAPTGWHVATDAEWQELEATIGFAPAETAQTGWRGDGLAPDLVTLNSSGWPSGIALFGTNRYGFSALPSGCRISDGRVNIASNTAFWWSPSSNNQLLHYRYIDANYQGIFRQIENPHYGMCIRCVKD